MSSPSRRIAAVLLTASLAVPGLARAEDDIYPLEAIARPLTLPGGVWQAGIDLVTDQTVDAVGATVLGDYGVTDALQLGLGYGFSLHDFDAKGEALAQASYLYLSIGALEGMAFAALGYSFADEALAPVELGSLFWYTLGDAFAVYAIPTLTATLSEIDEGAGTSVRPVLLSLPVVAVYQPASPLYLELGTELANIGIADSETRIFGADQVPVDLAALYSPVAALDIGVSVSWDDVAEDAGALGILALARYRGGLW